ncbi:MAG: GNAT family N-acetyltransferase [Clostridia bacterium]|nr:GNAT family N-acetyltransferase [Clostridia bacterium]
MNETINKIEIIKSNIQHIDNIIPLFLRLNQYHYDNIDDYYKEYTRKKVTKLIRRAIENNKRDIYIAKKGRDVVGLVEIQFKTIEDNIELLDKEYIEINSLVVDSDYRSEGVGTKLLNFVDGLAVEYEKEYVELKVFDFNDSAITFYEKNGFKPFACYYRKYK